MADVYLVYAQENHDTASHLYQLLSLRWDVWWDDKIVGRYNSAIKKNIAETKCIIALFSSFADKPTVTEELKMGETFTQNIIPLTLDNSAPPYPFGAYSSIDFRTWQGEHDHPGFQQLQRRLSSVVAPKGKPSRPEQIANQKVPLPGIFMSVSSHETQFSPVDALTALKIHKTPAILVSAYDLMKSKNRKKMISKIKSYRKQGGFVLIDSGHYEAFRLNDKDWKVSNLKQALFETPHDWAFCFDRIKPNSNPDRAVREIINEVERNSKFTTAPVLPIVHVKPSDEGIKHLPQIVRRVSEYLLPPVIAIPERELGAGLANRAKTVKAIRDELNKLSYYQPIHLLGTGHPWSIAILAAAGADTFDGLEWCRFSVDPDKERLHHFQHFDFFRGKSSLSSAFLDIVNADTHIEYAAQVAFHNLEYYQSIGDLMRKMFLTGSEEAFVLGVTGMKSNEIRKIFPGIFS
ncbi:toll/interleukin-1 receptor domain-containing protein [Klebsiella grimontii]|uniref:toll/interleukin-1 receptor domain-containing protein n=1 Tax=Klebsiella grimontii TaxID=2058152 RepID=UPI001CCBB990|nr:toll/interleukin-1 receptor domain-containing protein [Klebsiella grimontii]MBZ7653185.1 TIR domain-containing protein [Klebsiella grimontii]